MSIIQLVLIQVIVLLVFSWVLAAVMIGKFRSKNREQADQIDDLKRETKQLRRQLKQAEKAAEQSLQESDETVSSGSEDDIDSLINDMNASLKKDSTNLSELDTILQSQKDSMARIRKMHENLDSKKKTNDDKKLQKELSSVKKQNKRSQDIINKLDGDLERSRSRLKSVEKEMTRLRANSGRINDLERSAIRLTSDKSALEKKLAREMVKHQTTIERIRAQLQISEKKNRDYLEERASREQSLLNTINELQNKLREAADGDDSEELVLQLQQELDSAQEALGRAVREKDFMETHFVELEKALEESSTAQEELDRTKREYQMLEEHFLELASEDEKREEALSDPSLLEPVDVSEELEAAAAAELEDAADTEDGDETAPGDTEAMDDVNLDIEPDTDDAMDLDSIDENEEEIDLATEADSEKDNLNG